MLFGMGVTLATDRNHSREHAHQGYRGAACDAKPHTGQPPRYRYILFFETVDQNVEPVVPRPRRCIRKNRELRARHFVDVRNLRVRRQVQDIQLRHQFIAFRNREPDTDTRAGTDTFIRYNPDSLELRYIHDSQLFGLTRWNQYSSGRRPKC